MRSLEPGEAVKIEGTLLLGHVAAVMECPEDGPHLTAMELEEVSEHLLDAPTVGFARSLVWIRGNRLQQAFSQLLASQICLAELSGSLLLLVQRWLPEVGDALFALVLP